VIQVSILGAQKSDKPRPHWALAVTVQPGKTGQLVALGDDTATVPLPDWLYDHPLALTIVIRTVNIVLRNGATLCGNPDRCALTLSPGPGYRNLTLNRDRGAG
jgi:hypothetical protein